MSNRRFVIAAGGTGGHVFPAISLAHQLKKRGDSVLFIGGGLGLNRFFQKDTFLFRDISCGRPSVTTPSFPFRVAKGTWQSMRVLKAFRTDLLIGFGSYYTLPALIAARMMRIPYVIHEQNSIPGRVNRFFAKSAQLTAVHFSSVTNCLKGNCCHVAMPLRPEFDKSWEGKEAKQAYTFNPNLPVLLVFGGSQGAEAINALMYESAKHFSSWQILHFTGNTSWNKKLSNRYASLGIHSCVKTFEENMAKAWGAADLAFTRAGAASLAEQIVSGVPGILIPYPYATDQHQEANADYLVKLGGAVKLSQKELSCDKLVDTVDSIVPKLGSMRSLLKDYRTCQMELIDCLEVV